MPLPFKKLRDDMYCADPRILQPDLAEALECSMDHANRLLNNRAIWTLKEMYAALELVGGMPEQLHEYFPKSAL